MILYNFISVFLLAGTIQGVLLAFALYFQKKGNSTGNRLLAIFILLFAVSVVLHVLGHAGYLTGFPEHIALISVLAYGYSPVLYLYILFFTGKKSKLTLQDLFHGLPALTALITIVFYMSIESLQSRLNISVVLMVPLLIHYFSYMGIRYYVI